MFSSFLFHEPRVNSAPFFFSARPFFECNLPRAFSVSDNVSFSYVRDKWRIEIRVLFCLWQLFFFFELPHLSMIKILLERPYFKKRRWCCAHDAHIMFFISAHNHGIPTHNSFLAPALRCTLFASCSLLLSARCSMIGYCVS